MVQDSGALKKVLVIGGGGREHAICWKMARSERVDTVHVLPGSPGIAALPKVQLVSGVSVKDFSVSEKALGALLIPPCSICFKRCELIRDLN